MQEQQASRERGFQGTDGLDNSRSIRIGLQYGQGFQFPEGRLVRPREIDVILRFWSESSRLDLYEIQKAERVHCHRRLRVG